MQEPQIAGPRAVTQLIDEALDALMNDLGSRSVRDDRRDLLLQAMAWWASSDYTLTMDISDRRFLLTVRRIK
jgi:hypothetical protein